jgi:hypothetical protein
MTIRKKPKRARRPAVKVVIIVDPMGSFTMNKTGDDEYAEHVETYTNLLAPRKATFQQKFYVLDDMSADLVVFDFGGMMPGNDLMGSNSRRLARWLEDHPSSLAVVASEFTYRNGLLPELRELGLYVAESVGENQKRLDASEDVYERAKTTPIHNLLLWTGWEEETGARIKAWFK